MKRAAAWGVVLVLGFAAVAYLTRREPAGPPAPPTLGPASGQVAPSSSAEADLAHGRALFDRHCLACHGPEGRGSQAGPALVHAVYVPSHHADEAFLLAVARGVRAHHWRFGDMPPLPDVPPAQVKLIIAYLRDLQGKAGFF